MKLTLIRHTAVDVPSGTCYGQTDVPLKETFPEEAQAVLENLPKVHFDAAFTSPLSRASKLAAYCGFPDARPDARLMEMNFGEWEMKCFDQITDPKIQEWYMDYINKPATGGESFMDVYGRISSFIDEMRSSGYQNVIAFAHGGILMCAMIYAGMATPQTIFSMQPPYGGMICIDLPTD